MTTIVSLKKITNFLLPIVIFLYWIVLIIVQNFLKLENGSVLNTFIKVLLLLMLVLAYFFNYKSINLLALVFWILFSALSMYLLFFRESSITGRNIVYYISPLVFSFCVFVIRPKKYIDKNSLIKFLRYFVILVLIMCFYSLIFQFNSIRSFFATYSPYGREMTSFFLSNHEYGMYLVFGIASCILMVRYSRKRIFKRLNVLTIILFAFCLVFTFSRTSYLALVLMIATFLVLSKNKKAIFSCLFLVGIGLIILMFSSKFQSFVNALLFKNDQNGNSREQMWSFIFNYYRSSNYGLKLCGNGYTDIVTLLQVKFKHTSLHNAFLNILVIWGVLGLSYLILLIYVAFKNSLRVYRSDSLFGSFFFALTIASIGFMLTNTACLMYSPIDSFLLTAFVLFLPYNFKTNTSFNIKRAT